jgi:hypothetical protein
LAKEDKNALVKQAESSSDVKTPLRSSQAQPDKTGSDTRSKSPSRTNKIKQGLSVKLTLCLLLAVGFLQ